MTSSAIYRFMRRPLLSHNYYFSSHITSQKTSEQLGANDRDSLYRVERVILGYAHLILSTASKISLAPPNHSTLPPLYALLP